MQLLRSALFAVSIVLVIALPATAQVPDLPDAPVTAEPPALPDGGAQAQGTTLYDRCTTAGPQTVGDDSVRGGQRPAPQLSPELCAKAEHVIVTYGAPAVNAQARANVRRDNNVNLVDALHLIDGDIVRGNRGEHPEAVAARLRADDRVRSAEVNQLWFPTATNDTDYGQLWGLENVGQTIVDQVGITDVDIDAPEAWSTTRGASSLVVGVIDEGIGIPHPDLMDQIWVNPGEICGNGVDDEGNGFVDDCHGWDFFRNDNTVWDPSDGDDHGTHVGGTIAATADNGIGIAGVAPDVQLMALKFLGPNGGVTSDAIRAVQYAADNGAALTNNSWGGGDFSQALYDAIAAARMPFIAAAGNANRNTDTAPAYPASYDLPNILSVAAVDNRGNRASFSNYGATTVDVGAPGVRVLSTIPGQGFPALQTDWTGSGQGFTDKEVFFGFGLQDVDGAADRASLLADALSFLDAVPGSSSVLVVNDEATANAVPTHPFVQAALDAGGFTSTVIDVAVGANGPDAATMGNHDVVIWNTGLAVDSGNGLPNLTGDDLANLLTNADNAGRLLLMGQDAILGNEANFFVQAVMGVRWITDRVTYPIVVPSPGSFAAASSSFSLSGADYSGGARTSRDTVAPDSNTPARPVLNYDPEPGLYAYYNGTSMASPHAAGIAALVLSINPTLSGEEVVRMIANTGVPLSALSGITVTGDLVNANNAVAAAVASVECLGQPVTVNLNLGQVPTVGDDVIMGTPGPDTINALAGRDLICGAGGDDDINGGGGNDVVDGGDGNDRILGHDGADDLRGGDGDDEILGGDQGDTIDGGDGDDSLYGGLGQDVVDGGPGGDYLIGNGGHDTLRGGDGPDDIVGGLGEDRIETGDGGDLTFGARGNASNDHITGGAGDDTLHGGGGLDILNGLGGTDTLFGSGGDDQIFGGDLADRLNGGNGNDLMYGESGDDLMFGLGGDDALFGGDGDDTLRGKDGDDTLIGNAGDDLLDGGIDNDYCDGGPHVGGDTAINCETLNDVP